MINTSFMFKKALISEQINNKKDPNSKIMITSKEANSLIHDLENTYEINHKMMEEIIIVLEPNLITFANKIKKIYENKKALQRKKLLIKSKILLDKQIGEEIYRRQEEDNVIIKQELEELEETFEKKDNLINQHDKKFKEVEIYARREFINISKNPDVYLFNKSRFLYENEYYHKIIQNSKESLKQYIDNMVSFKVDCSIKRNSISDILIAKLQIINTTLQKKNEKLSFIKKYFKDISYSINKNKEVIANYLENINSIVIDRKNKTNKRKSVESIAKSYETLNFQDYYLSNYNTNYSKIDNTKSGNINNIYNNYNFNNIIITTEQFKADLIQQNPRNNSFVVSKLEEDNKQTNRTILDLSNIDEYNTIINNNDSIFKRSNSRRTDIGYLLSIANK